MPLLGWTNIASVVLLALVLAFGFYERSGWQSEIAARAQDLAAAEKAAADAQAADAAKTRALEDAHAAEIAKLKDQANARDVSIALAPDSSVCAVSPPMRALFDGLRGRPGSPRAGQPRSAGGTRAAVP
jgi:hypothetical protein